MSDEKDSTALNLIKKRLDVSANGLDPNTPLFTSTEVDLLLKVMYDVEMALDKHGAPSHAKELTSDGVTEVQLSIVERLEKLVESLQTPLTTLIDFEDYQRGIEDYMGGEDKLNELLTEIAPLFEGERKPLTEDQIQGNIDAFVQMEKDIEMEKKVDDRPAAES